jgi:hypothetical protein
MTDSKLSNLTNSVNPEWDGHDSDCAVHNMPASPNGPCDCGATSAGQRHVDMVNRLIEAAIYNDTAEIVYRSGAARELAQAIDTLLAALREVRS